MSYIVLEEPPAIASSSFTPSTGTPVNDTYMCLQVSTPPTFHNSLSMTRAELSHHRGKKFPKRQKDDRPFTRMETIDGIFKEQIGHPRRSTVMLF